MSYGDLDWDLCRSFLAVIREGSLSGAARSLGLTQPTVGRHIESLETRLGVKLFVRWQRGLQPTELALNLAPHAETMATANATLIRAASGEAGEERGTVRLTASEMMGAEVLPAMLAAFHELHPGIVIELVLSNRTEDLLRREADIAVRMVRPEQIGLVARLVGLTPISLYAHRSYVERHGLPCSFEELARHALIGYDTVPSVPSVASIGNISVTRELFSLRTDSDLAQLAAIRAGYGIGGCQDALARRTPDLLPVMCELIHFELPIWLVMHEDLRTNRRVRLLYEHLVLSVSGYLGKSTSS